MHLPCRGLALLQHLFVQWPTVYWQKLKSTIMTTKQVESDWQTHESHHGYTVSAILSICTNTHSYYIKENYLQSESGIFNSCTTTFKIYLFSSHTLHLQIKKKKITGFLHWIHLSPKHPMFVVIFWSIQICI